MAALQVPTKASYGFSITLTLVALAARLFVAFAWAREPVWDGHYYHFGAERIAQGLGYSEDVLIHGLRVWKPWVHYPVGYSALLGGVYRIFGADAWVAPVVNALVGSLTALTTYRVACHYLSPLRSQIAGALVALHPGLIAYTALVMTEALAGWLMLLALAAKLRYPSGWRSVVIPGVVIGLATLVRPACILVAPLLALTERRAWLRPLSYAAGVSLVAVATVLPWTLRNCERMDGCAFVSTNGGWNLAIGALTDTGRFRTLRAADGCPIVTGQVQQDRCWGDVGLAAIRHDPGRWIGLIPKKLGHTFDHESFPVEYLREADPRSWPDERRQAARLLFSNFHRAVLFFAALGVVARVRWSRERKVAARSQGLALAAIVALAAYAVWSPEHPFFWLVPALLVIGVCALPGRPTQGAVGRVALGLIAVTAGVHAVFFGDDRYHVVVVPELCLLAAAALRLPEAGRYVVFAGAPAVPAAAASRVPGAAAPGVRGAAAAAPGEMELSGRQHLRWFARTRLRRWVLGIGSRSGSVSSAPIS